MVLLQQAASVAAKFYDNIELIEMHHNQKADSPSGTCIKTAEMIEEYPKKFNESLVKDSESLKGVRGGIRDSECIFIPESLSPPRTPFNDSDSFTKFRLNFFGYSSIISAVFIQVPLGESAF